MTQERLREEGPLSFNPSIAKADEASFDLPLFWRKPMGVPATFPLFLEPADEWRLFL
jgi:hypothetical protein